MKRLSFIVMAAAVLSLIAACSEKNENDGVYNPKKKIAKVYESSLRISKWYDNYYDTWQSDTTVWDKALSESWTWDGDKLTKITFYETHGTGENASQEVSEVINFTYNGEQLVRFEGEDEYMTFVYDGKELKSADLYDKDHPAKPLAKFSFEHNGGKIVKIILTQDEDDEWRKGSSRNMEKVLLRTVMPDEMTVDKTVDKINKTMSKSGAKGEVSIPFTLTWSGDNVSEVSATQTMDGETSTATIHFTYDKKNNPYKDLLFGILGLFENGEAMVFSKNNVTKSVTEYIYQEGPEIERQTHEENYTYTYDGDWPTYKEQEESYEGDEYSSYRKNCTYFEYLK